MGVYVVTGGSGGIGGKTVEILREQGHEVINVDLKDSDISANLATKEGRDEVIQKIHELHPEDIANVIVFLVSPLAHGINGNVMFVDGGTDALLNSEKVY